MKKLFICLLLIATFTVSAFAIEAGDYGYYDTTKDGKIEIADVLGVLDQVLNDEEGGSLLRAVRTLKMSASNVKVVYPTITEINLESGTVFMTLATTDKNIKFTVPISKVGFDESYNKALYLDGIVTMTVHSDFEATADTSLIYAAEAFCRYDTLSVELDRFANAEALASALDATLTKTDSKVVFADVYGKSVTVDIDENGNAPTVAVAEGLGAYVSIKEDSNKVTVIKQFSPIVSVTDVSGKAGEEVSVTVALAHNPGIAGLQVELGYDSSILSYVLGVKASNVMMTQISPTAGANPVKIAMVNMSLKNVVGNLTLATLTFRISENAAPGTYPLVYKSMQIYDRDIYALRCAGASCTITVEE